MLTSTAARRRQPRTAWRWLGLMPFLLFAVIFGIYPFAQVLRMAFSTVSLGAGQFDWTFVGLDNFVATANSPLTWKAIQNTGVFVFGGTVGSLVVGVALALLVDRSVRILPVARQVLIWPAVVAPVIVSLMWLLLLSPTAGGINKVLESIGAGPQLWLNSEATAMASVIAVDIWHWTPVVFIFIYTALQAIDGSILESARIDGADELAVVRRVVLPLIARSIIAVGIVRVVMCIRAFDEMFLLTAGGPNGATSLVSLRITTLFFNDLDYGGASALGLAVVVGTSVLLGLLLHLRSRVAVVT